MRSKTCCILVALFFVQTSKAQNWESVNGGANNGLGCIFTDTLNNTLYATGYFDSIGGIYSPYIAKWDGTSWSSMGSGLTNFAGARHVFDIYNNKLVFVGAIFNPVYTNVASWNGTSWDSIGSNFRDGF